MRFDAVRVLKLAKWEVNIQELLFSQAFNQPDREGRTVNEQLPQLSQTIVNCLGYVPTQRSMRLQMRAEGGPEDVVGHFGRVIIY